MAEVEANISNLLLQKQRLDYEKKLDDLKKQKNTRGRCASIFNLKAKILGKKKVSQEAATIEDPDTGETISDAKEIKATSLKGGKSEGI